MGGITRLRNLTLLIMATFAVGDVAHASVTISTLGSIASFPAFVPATAIGLPGDFGETITAPSLPVVELESFQFEFGSAGTVPVNFRAGVFNFDPVNLKVIGSPLYQSSVLSALPIGLSGNYQLFNFNTGDISLVPGNSYLLLLSQDNLQNTTNYQIPITPSQDGDVYTGGQVIIVNASTPFPNLSNDYTNTFLPGQDLAFSATFDAPEPSSVIGMVLVASLCAMRRRHLPLSPLRGQLKVTGTPN